MSELPQMPSFSLSGKVALVTGASSGIGQGAAVALASSGAHVICVARGEERLKASVDAMTKNGMSAEAKSADISDLKILENLVMSSEADIVVNAAAVARHGLAIETTPENYDEMMNVNLRAAYFLSVFAARDWLGRKISGSLIHISSQMGHVGGAERAVYCAGKHALEGMTKAMAIEWGEAGIRINTICPTFIRTPFTEKVFNDPKKLDWVRSKIRLGRIGEVSDIMGAVVYLASDASSMVTGTHLLVDGGWTAG